MSSAVKVTPSLHQYCPRDAIDAKNRGTDEDTQLFTTTAPNTHDLVFLHPEFYICKCT